MTATANSTCTADFSMEECLRAYAEFKALCEEHKRKADKAVERMECCACGYKPRFVRDCSGEILRVCRHIWDDLQRVCERSPVDDRRPLATLMGIRVEVQAEQLTPSYTINPVSYELCKMLDEPGYWPGKEAEP